MNDCQNLVRAMPSALTLRAADDEVGMPTMLVGFIRFNEWTEINSAREGYFLERIAPEAVTETFANDRERMRVLFQHGRDPSIGDKVLGPIADLRAEPTGGVAEVPMLDTSYNRDLLPALRENLYGASFRFDVTAEDKVRAPKRSDYNPDGIPERTVRQMRVYEFGPVTFPAYAGATAGVRMRSLTDQFFPDRQEPAGEPRDEQIESAEYGKTGTTPRSRRIFLLSHR